MSKFLKESDMKLAAVLSVVLFLIVSSFTVTAFAIQRNHQITVRQDKTQAQQDKQIEFLCRTTSSLTSVLTAAANQIDTNIANGTYDRLVARHLLTKENVEAAKITAAQYRAQIALLNDPKSPCFQDGKP